ncbi:hypothetical protein [Sandaracinus amylolyticus]|uniref:hypothetical protein n=1 Tax=Sandaracinus amylolyticus TaxID=927083 RepID=UPI001F19EEC3|nr:hypothetical protein [Sandaracinus amylolyticus]
MQDLGSRQARIGLDVGVWLDVRVWLDVGIDRDVRIDRAPVDGLDIVVVAAGDEGERAERGNES